MSELKNVLTIGRYLKNKFGEKEFIKFLFQYLGLLAQILMELLPKEDVLFVKMTPFPQICKKKNLSLN